MEAVDGGRIELAGEEPARALGRAATAVAEEVAEATLVLAGVEPARAACLVVGEGSPRSRPPGRASLAVVGELAAAEVVEGGLFAAAQRAATLASTVALQFTVAGAAAGVAAGWRSSQGLSWQRRLDAAASECSEKVASERRGVVPAVTWRVGEVACPLCLPRSLLLAAEAGRRTACSSDSGCGHGGAGGIIWPRCCGMGAAANGTLVAGCVPRISRVHMVVLPALRGSQACLRPTAESVEFSPHVEHHSVSSESHMVWSGE